MYKIFLICYILSITENLLVLQRSAVFRNVKNDTIFLFHDSKNEKFSILF